MARIRARKASDGRVRYTAEVRLKGFDPIAQTFDNKTHAQHWAQQKEAEMRSGRYRHVAEAQKHTLSEVIARYKRDVLPKRKSDQKKVSMHLDWWDSKLGNQLLSDITSVRLAEYRDKLSVEAVSKGKDKEAIKSSATVNRYIASLSIALTTAVEWGWLEENPLRKVRKLTESRGRVRYLSEEERDRLLKTCKESQSPHLYKIVVLALSTGARYGEILKLTWKEVDLKQKVIRLEETKNGDRRAIPVRGLALTLLEEASKVRKINSSYVFPSKDGQKPADIRDAWELALLRAKITDFRFHDLRHTAASYLAMNGATLVEISTILGHKTMQMVKRYAHLTEQHTASVLERMNAQQFGCMDL